jgi:hypothetical protein
MQGKSKARAPRIDEQTERKQIVVHAPCNCHDGFKASLIAGSLCQDQSTLFGSNGPFRRNSCAARGQGRAPILVVVMPLHDLSPSQKQ